MALAFGGRAVCPYGMYGEGPSLSPCPTVLADNRPCQKKKGLTWKAFVEGQSCIKSHLRKGSRWNSFVSAHTGFGRMPSHRFLFEDVHIAHKVHIESERALVVDHKGANILKVRVTPGTTAVTAAIHAGQTTLAHATRTADALARVKWLIGMLQIHTHATAARHRHTIRRAACTLLNM